MTVTINGTTGVAGVDGTASTPAIQGNDTNTGIFFPAADTIAFAEGGAEVARFDSSGNLGIGTNSPAFPLDVAGAMRSNSWIGRTNVSAPSGDAAIYRAADNTLGFSTASTERMRIDSSGRLLVNGGTGYGTLTIAATATNIGTVTNSAIWVNLTSSSYKFSQFEVNGGPVGSITTNGSTTSYNTSSDYRLKEDIAPMTGALATVSALKPCTYTWKADGSQGQGFIAHELAEVCPDAVTGEKDAVDADGKIKPQGIDTSFLVATLTAALQELNAKVDSLQAELATLKGQA